MLYVIQKEGKTLLWGHDSVAFPDYTLDSLKSFVFDLVVFDCTAVGEPSPWPVHMGMPDNRRTEEKLRAQGSITDKTRIVVTHFCHRFNPLHEHVEEEAAKYGYIAAYDGFTIEI